MARCRSNNRDQCYRTGVGHKFKWRPPPLASPRNKLPTMSLGRVAHERQKIQLTPAAKDISCGRKQFGVGTVNNYYSVSVRRLGKPPQWQWEIQRRPKPLGVKLCGAGFKSESAAKLGGEKALRKLLDSIAHERIAGAR